MTETFQLRVLVGHNKPKGVLMLCTLVSSEPHVLQRRSRLPFTAQHLLSRAVHTRSSDYLDDDIRKVSRLAGSVYLNLATARCETPTLAALSILGRTDRQDRPHIIHRPIVSTLFLLLLGYVARFGHWRLHSKQTMMCTSRGSHKAWYHLPVCCPYHLSHVLAS
ncbi:hypothetical protein BKA63DRAFT_510062 [Paraphoma chrysanthemicola]|nr:hypothetical protein BKA63DRAFT_510062 [Paraphoma chrysanthemicola]